MKFINKRAKWYETRLLNLLAMTGLLDDSCRVSCDNLTTSCPTITLFRVKKDVNGRLIVDKTRLPITFTLQELLKYDSEAVSIENRSW